MDCLEPMSMRTYGLRHFVQPRVRVDEQAEVEYHGKVFGPPEKGLDDVGVVYPRV